MLLLGMVTAFALVAGCGGDDDDDDGGDDGGAVGGGGGGGGTGSDENFVSDLCKAGAKLSKDIDAALKDVGTSTDLTKIAEKITGPFEEFAKAFDKAKPPKDLQDWYTQANNGMKQTVKSLKETKDFSGVTEEDDPFPEMPAAAEERLTKIAEKNKDCQEAGYFDD